MGELVEEIPPHHEITQVPQLKMKLGCAISRGTRSPYTATANQKRYSTFGLSKAEIVFNFPVGGMQLERATATPSRLRLWLHCINHTPLLAAQVNGRVNF